MCLDHHDLKEKKNCTERVNHIKHMFNSTSFSCLQQMTGKIAILILLLVLSSIQSQGRPHRMNDAFHHGKEEPWRCYDDEDCVDLDPSQSLFTGKHISAPDDQRENDCAFKWLKQRLIFSFEERLLDTEVDVNLNEMEKDSISEWYSHFDFGTENCFPDDEDCNDEYDNDDNDREHYSENGNGNHVEPSTFSQPIIVQGTTVNKDRHIYF